MRHLAQWFLWRNEWDAVAGKYRKTPCAPDGSTYRVDASKPENWMSVEVAEAALARLPQSAQLRYSLGFWLTEGCGYWFLDLDGVVGADGVWDAGAAAMVARFPGAMVELSVSGSGLHVIGRLDGPLGPHRTRPRVGLDLPYEFYTHGRGIALGQLLSGSPEVVFGDEVRRLVFDVFPADAGVDGMGVVHERRPEWRGPEDDDELIRRALQAKPSAAQVFGGKPTFAQLWRGDAEKCSESDLALASHLSFWTGADEVRVERLMRRSGLKRDKWDEHRTYLQELTVRRACATATDVYKEPAREVARAEVAAYGAPGEVPAETFNKVDELLAMVSSAGTLAEMHNAVIPAVRAAAIPTVLIEPLVRAVNKRMDFWDAKMPVAKLRALLSPGAVQLVSGDAPDWCQRHCYVHDGDYFMDMENGACLSFPGFQAEFSRLMPFKESGVRENPVEWALQKWGMRTVHRVAYRPDQPPYFHWDGMDYANTYNESSVPVIAPPTDAGKAGIEAFRLLLWDMSGHRPDVYGQLLQWLAHNAQRPGVKLRWSPLLKGVQGDGKSIIGAFMRSAMGYRNVGITGNATLTNSGGFNDWAVGHALNVIEEIMLTGKERHRLYNSMKEFISNNVVNINAKGKVGYMAYNVTNHLATTNHNDAIPLESTDRRWMVVFTPWGSLDEMARYGSITRAELQARFDVIDHAMSHCSGELRAWLLSIDVSTLERQAPFTVEKGEMKASSRDGIESLAESIIVEGREGVSEMVLCSASLSAALRMVAAQEGEDVPRNNALSHMLTRMGYRQKDKPMWWSGKNRRIWVKNGQPMEHEEIISTLNSTTGGSN